MCTGIDALEHVPPGFEASPLHLANAQHQILMRPEGSVHFIWLLEVLACLFPVCVIEVRMSPLSISRVYVNEYQENELEPKKL